MMTFRSFAIVCSFAAGTALAQDPSSLIQREMQRQKVPGCSVAVVRAGKVVFAKGFGIANQEWKAKATAETVYRIGSVTKQFCAALILMLQDEGKLKLDDPISMYWKGGPEYLQKVTIRQMLNHTSGIPNYTENTAFVFSPTALNVPRFNQFLADTKPTAAPGERWSYCNTAYWMLGEVVATVSGKSFEAFLKERITDPLRMTQTRYFDVNRFTPYRAAGYSWSKDRVINAIALRSDVPGAAGAMESTVLDLAKWDIALRSKKLLSEKSYKEWWTPAPLNGGGTYPYGMGWAVAQDSVSDEPLISHSGGIPGFTSYICRFPASDLSVIVLTNVLGGDESPQIIAHRTARLFLPAQEPKPIKDIEPKLTRSLEAVIEGLSKGKVRDDLVSPDMAKVLKQFASDVSDLLSTAGTPLKLQLVSETRSGKEVRRKYVGIGKTASIAFRVAFDDAGIITGMQSELY